ncbi:pseudouridine synthase [Endogone sp. FLAS-F59071]|nr:pseudouridine synthase [Endogone sp. FLAS-F59071]|eukprot:RUS20161.1 pseudouridine synthase [Endogone sp. FLAS-F59071]
MDDTKPLDIEPIEPIEDAIEPPIKRPRLDDQDSKPEPSTITTLAPSNPAPSGPVADAPQLREADVGITEYLDTSIPGWSGVIKQRFTDFMVNEVDLNGDIVHLRDMALPRAASAIEELEEEPETPLSEEAIYAEMTALLGTECAEQVKKMVNSGGADVSFVMAPAETDKVKRTATHQFFKKHFPGRITTETHEGAIKIRMFMMKDARDRRNRRPDSFEALGGVYCEFCLFKENRDTMEVINMISQLLKVNPQHFGYAGTKDRRAVTVQRVTAFKIKAERIAGLNRNSKFRGVKFGNFRSLTSPIIITSHHRYVSNPLKLGDLKGNHFVITLRNVIAPSETAVHASLTSLRECGFVNYYGMQRFGTSAVSTHTVGRALLRGEWEEAVELIMMPRPGEREEFQAARQHWHEHHDPSAALRLFPRRCVAETQILSHFAKGKSGVRDFAGALAGVGLALLIGFVCRSCFGDHSLAVKEPLCESKLIFLLQIPRNLRLMYVHAYQSYVWNNMASERIRLYGYEAPVVGDIVMLGDGEEGLNEVEAMEIDEAEMIKGKGKEKEKEKGKGGEDGKKKSAPAVKVLTDADDLAAYTIQDVVLPQPGFDIVYPANVIGAKYKEIMGRDGLDPTRMWKNVKDYSLPGAYRKLMAKPRDVSWTLLRYNDPRVALALTDLDVLEGKPEPTNEPDGTYLAVRLHLTLQSSQYATMALREVCKQDTSATFQATLNQSASDGEAKLEKGQEGEDGEEFDQEF